MRNLAAGVEARRQSQTQGGHRAAKAELGLHFGHQNCRAAAVPAFELDRPAPGILVDPAERSHRHVGVDRLPSLDPRQVLVVQSGHGSRIEHQTQGEEPDHFFHSQAVLLVRRDSEKRQAPVGRLPWRTDHKG
ncbi:hypothetical protein SDC9_186184 [bioreactor metagenome]|uniref:Uncharacterized protein n=1 Tax=bioreactor metagenome TaxID=1076179 RepID=A0A645HIT8_9ZZZZ